MINKLVFDLTTDASGVATVQAPHPDKGTVYQFEFINTDMAATAVATLSVVDGDQGTPLFISPALATSPKLFCPRADSCSATGVTGITNSVPIAFSGFLKISIATGGITKKGRFVVYVDTLAE